MNSLSGGLAHQANSLMGFNASSSLNIATNTNNTMANAGGVNGHVGSNSNLNNLLLVQQLLSNSLPQLQNVVNGANPVTMATVAAAAASNSSNSMSGEILIKIRKKLFSDYHCFLFLIKPLFELKSEKYFMF